MSPSLKSDTRYYPTERDFESPTKMRAALQQVLKQHYELAEQHEALKQRVASMPPPNRSASNGPTDTVMLGVPVQPVDTTTLANGASLKWDKASGTFKFS